jgi:hypothetical protein
MVNYMIKIKKKKKRKRKNMITRLFQLMLIQIISNQKIQKITKLDFQILNYQNFIEYINLYIYKLNLEKQSIY